MTTLNNIIYDSVPQIVNSFEDKMYFLAVIGSFASGEETIHNGKYLSDIDYYVVLREGTSKLEGQKIGNTLQKALNAINSNPPKSIWVVDYNSFYNDNAEDTLSPYQIAETNTIIVGSTNLLDPIRHRPIGLHSQIGLCGVSFMDMCNGLENKKINSLLKGVYEQMGVWLISKNKFRTKYSDRLEEFLKEFPEFYYLSNPLEKIIKIKRNLDLREFNHEFGSAQLFNQQFYSLFSDSSISRIFGKGDTIDTFCDNILDGSPERFIRASYICKYHQNNLLAEIYANNAAKLLEIDTAGKVGLDKINHIWFKWLTGIGILESDLKKS